MSIFVHFLCCHGDQQLSRVLGNKNIFKIPDGVIYEAKCPIVQLVSRYISVLLWQLGLLLGLPTRQPVSLQY